MKWLKTRNMNKEIEALTNEERWFFRQITQLTVRFNTLKSEIFDNYLVKDGTLPPVAVMIEFKRVRRDLKIATEKHSEIEIERDNLKRMARDVERGTNRPLVFSPKAKEILEKYRDEYIEATRVQIDDTLRETKKQKERLTYDELLEKTQADRDKVFEDIKDEVVTDFERGFLSEMMSSYPQEWEKVDDKVKKLVSDQDKEAIDTMGNY